MVYGVVKLLSVKDTGVNVSFLSWNLAMLSRPAYAPQHWELCDTEEVVREQILAKKPDVVHFQELPGLVPYIETHEMIRSNPQSHSGNLATLISRELLETEISHIALEGFALLTTVHSFGLTLANVHLAPGKSAGKKRLAQISQIVGASPSENLAIIGDTNTRSNEIETIIGAGLAAPKPPSPTWNSYKNRFHAAAPKFRTYFTRCFTHPNIATEEMQVLEGHVIRNDKEFFISDHFALFGQMLL